MTKEQVIAMAREAGAVFNVLLHARHDYVAFTSGELEKFATLVRNAAVIEERMALADLCDAMGSPKIAEYLRAHAEIIRKEPT